METHSSFHRFSHLYLLLVFRKLFLCCFLFLESTQDLLSQMRQVRWGGKFNDTQVSSHATKVQAESSFLLLFDNVAGLEMALIKVLFAILLSLVH